MIEWFYDWMTEWLNDWMEWSGVEWKTEMKRNETKRNEKMKWKKNGMKWNETNRNEIELNEMNERTNELMNGYITEIANFIFQKCSVPWFFFAISMWNGVSWSSRYSFVRILPTSSSKSVPRRTGFYDFYVKSSSRYSPVYDNFCRSRPESAETETLYFGKHGNFLRKNRGFRARVFSNLTSRVPKCHTTWSCCGWHDNVADMMVRMLAMTIVRNSEVF